MDVRRDHCQEGAVVERDVDLDPSQIDYRAETGELTFSPNPLGLSFNEVEVTYTAGFVDVPEPVKSACAQIVRNAQATPALNVRAGALDRMQMEYFSDSLLDASVRTLLAPYVSVRL